MPGTTTEHSPTALPLTRRRFLGLVLPLTAGFLAACSGTRAAREAFKDGWDDLLARPAQEQWPARFWEATPEVQEAYRYAVANADALRYIPCYCGCGRSGHTSNRDCYIREVRPDGTLVLDPMSFG